VARPTLTASTRRGTSSSALMGGGG
jgi:hypothetical protein